MIMRAALVSSLLSLMLMAMDARGETDPTNGYPNWHERGILVLSNACRIAPVQFRDRYIGVSGILFPANYPAVPPLYWHYNLNRGARVHSADMANNCGLRHSSCDGTAWDIRVPLNYANKNQNIGENIATGESSPLGTMQQWIIDATNDNPVAADRSDDDGHRRNIMNSGFKEMGAGYAYGPQKYRHFWTQDLGGGTPDATPTLVCGTHLFLDEGTVKFMAVYYDVSSGASPSKAHLVFGPTTQSLSLELGAGAKGIYSVALPSGPSCRYYHFEFTDASDRAWRYPEDGYLVTYGEGNCTEYYSTETTKRGYGDSRGIRPVPMMRFLDRSTIAVELPRGFGPLLELKIYAVDGARAGATTVMHAGRGVIQIRLDSVLAAGVYTVVLRMPHGKAVTQRALLAD